MTPSHRILLVDDSRDTVEALERVLRRRHFQIDCAINSRRALALLRQESYDLLITDLRMPQTDGLQLTIHAKLLHPAIKVVLITAYSNLYDVERGKRCGIDLFLTKPFDPACLIEELNQMLGIPVGADQPQLAALSESEVSVS